MTATLLHRLAQTFGNVAIEGWEALFQIFYHRHLRTEAVEDRSELHADDASTDDGKALGEGIEIQQACAVNHAWVVNALDGKPFRLGTRGDDDVRGSVFSVCCD